MSQWVMSPTQLCSISLGSKSNGGKLIKQSKWVCLPHYSPMLDLNPMAVEHNWVGEQDWWVNHNW